MSRKDDLEQLVRDSYDIIHQYEEVIQTSDRPEEVQRAQRQCRIGGEPQARYVGF